MPLTWEPGMSTGHDHLDEQHKQLARGINDLMDAIQRRRSKEHVLNLLAEIKAHGAKHFEDEDCCMAAAQCSVRALNQRAHEVFWNDLVSICDRVEAEGPSLSLLVEVEEKMAMWYLRHVKSIDRKLRDEAA